MKLQYHPLDDRVLIFGADGTPICAVLPIGGAAESAELVAAGIVSRLNAIDGTVEALKAIRAKVEALEAML
jgi:hypothetical protein